MSGNGSKKYWKSLDERDAERFSATEGEFPEIPSAEESQLGRRDFLKAAGFVFAGSVLTGCSPAPVEKAIPFLIQPEEMIPGRAYYYASTCGGCGAGCGLLVKDRDGRPIKLEGNPQHPVSQGGLCAVGQASVLELYDSLRLKNPLAQSKESTWEEIDRAVASDVERIRREGGAVRFLSGTITSPTTQGMIANFLKGFRDAKHVVYDALSSSAILDAHERTHGVRVLPHYRFEPAEVIISFDADFLGTWISPVEFTRGYRSGRSLEGTQPRLSYHVQFESRLSLSGCKADRRVRVSPDELGSIVTHLAVRLAKKTGVELAVRPIGQQPVPASYLDELEDRLWKARGRSLILSGSQDIATQLHCSFLNHVLGNYGSTLDIERPSLQRQGNDRELADLLGELREGKVAALFVHGVNPVYDIPAGSEMAAALKQVPLLVSFAERLDETASVARYVCPDHHPLESWSDGEPVSGVVGLTQPAIHPLGKTRAFVESLAAWTGAPKSSYDILREYWEANIFTRQSREQSFQDFWDRSVQEGFAIVESRRVQPRPFNLSAVQPLAVPPATPADSFDLILYPKVGILDGRHAHNAWLQELPDPISKVAWDNYACLAPAAAARLGLRQGDVVRIEVGGEEKTEALELPVVLQPGQHDRVVAVALGYGRKGTERFARVGPRWILGRLSVGEDGLVGKNAAPLLTFANGTLQYTRQGVRIIKAGNKFELASTQEHHTITVPKKLAVAGAERRPMIQETTLPVLVKGIESKEIHEAAEKEDLWPPDHPFTGHHWGMVVNLTACTGCSACVVACQAENNVPVVGKDEVRRRREMHWIRIDRYYSGEEGNVDVAHQPMMCQQCDHAPCETVCPVLATVHSEEGLNQQIYNRCVGTRYCANNCPYKVRRFNWFDYPQEDRLQNLVLNPDVTVRSRGVMEKCTFCVQRIQEAKIEAKRNGTIVADGAVRTACEQSCPAQAIVFGDMNDPSSRIAKLIRNSRHYRVLEEFNFQPSVGYLKLVRNRAEGEEEEHHG